MCVNCGVSSCSSCNTNSYIPDSTSALKYDGPKFVCPTDFTVLPGAPLNDVMNTLMGKICANSSGGGGGQVDSVVAGTNITVDNTDPINPIINASGGGGFTHYLGEEFEGGVIYYLYKDNLGVERGLIVNKAETLTGWQNTPTLTNADRSEDGFFNTALMTDSPAATYVNGLADDGFTDWYLPSVDELNLLFNNRYSAQKTLRTGGFTLLSKLAFYWSSTESNEPNAYYFNFIDGISSNTSKYSTNSVRAIRSF